MDDNLSLSYKDARQNEENDNNEDPIDEEGPNNHIDNEADNDKQQLNYDDECEESRSDAMNEEAVEARSDSSVDASDDRVKESNDLDVQQTDDIKESVAAAMGCAYGPQTSQHALRQRRKDFSHLFRDMYLGTAVTDEEPLATPQMSMKRGVELFGKDRIAAIKKEMKQLHDMLAIRGVKFTPEQERAALGYLT